MTPRQYEELVCKHFKEQGYKSKTTPYGGDWGVDVFATKGKEKLAIQTKMYGKSTRKVNRQMIMELQGAKDYFDCTKALLVTDGTLMEDAKKVANKLKIEIQYFDGQVSVKEKKSTAKLEPESISKKTKSSFDTIWEKYILPLQGKTLTRENGKTNKIVKVDWSGIDRMTSNNKKGKIKIEIFRLAVDKILSKGFITRDEINQNYVGRASSGVILILSKVPMFQISNNPIGLKLKK